MLVAGSPPELGERLRALRDGWEGLSVTQSHVAKALGVSLPLISSWESGKAVPPEERLKSYALFFATRRTRAGAAAKLLPLDDLTDDEERLRRELIDELIALREAALKDDGSAAPATGALGGRFWYFPDGQPVVILYNTFESLAALDYSQPKHPNYISQLANADIDGLLELVGHIRAENPTIEIRWKALGGRGAGADSLKPDDLSANLVLLGGAVESRGANPYAWLQRRMDLPIFTRLPDGGDEDYDSEFVVQVDEQGHPHHEGPAEEVYRPVFLRDSDAQGRPRLLSEPDEQGRRFPQLEYDVALLARQPNPLNLSASITICSGIFSRGAYGSVRSMTDASLRTRNEAYLYERFRDPEDRTALRPFWMLFHVPVLLGETLTPDLNRPFHRLRRST
jgi:transcriptional regulator with XRE-family HTH domain